MDGLNKGLEAKMDGLKKCMDGMEAKIDGIEEKMKGNKEDMKNGLKEDMEALKEGLTKLLQETIPNGKMVVDETHDEKKINFNHNFIDSNVGFKGHHIPKIDEVV